MYMGLVGVDIGKESVCQCKRCKSRGFSPWVGKVPWSRKWQPTPVFLPRESHAQRSLAGYSPLSHKELDTTECTHTHTFVCWLLWVFVAVCRLSLVECRLLIVVTSRCRADSRVHGLQ